MPPPQKVHFPVRIGLCTLKTPPSTLEGKKPSITSITSHSYTWVNGGGVNSITKLSGDGNQDHRSGAVRSYFCIRTSELDVRSGIKR